MGERVEREAGNGMKRLENRICNNISKKPNLQTTFVLKLNKHPANSGGGKIRERERKNSETEIFKLTFNPTTLLHRQKTDQVRENERDRERTKLFCWRLRDLGECLRF